MPLSLPVKSTRSMLMRSIQSSLHVPVQSSPRVSHRKGPRRAHQSRPGTSGEAMIRAGIVYAPLRPGQEMAAAMYHECKPGQSE